MDAEEDRDVEMKSVAIGVAMKQTAASHSVSPSSSSPPSSTSPSSSSSSSSSSDSTNLLVTVKQLSSSIFARIAASQHATDEDLQSLFFLFQLSFRKALEIVDSNSVTHVVALPSMRSFFQVEGSAPKPYVCFSHFCSCPAFVNSCILKDDALYCKHQLAALLASALGKCKRQDVPDSLYAKMTASDLHVPRIFK